MDCLFCKIIAGEIPADIIYHDDDVLVFNDINPQAPVHKIIIPKKHIATLNDITEKEAPLIGHMLLVAKNIAHELNIADSGYRTIFNCNSDAGQEVFHIHLHLLGGRKMHWPPG
ncbi:MAG: histidine triad nucleotide-binding protein [Gammaproteobacteria bacterium]|nr:histidine triad nucleotide-binding protein [Gammaproteobacteria bacterium]